MTTPTMLAAALDHEARQLQAFLDVLAAEQALLAEGAHDLDALAANTNAKQACALALEQAQGERAAALQALGLPNDRDGLRAAAGAAPGLASQVDALLALTEQAAALNTDNGAAIEVYQQHTQQALADLQTLIAGTRLYDAQGRTRAQPGKLVGRS